jgi:pyridoxine/pyridoxamine 5'-phosphate oxidase
MSDATYYAQREQAERALATAANDSAVRNVHLILAEKYAELVRRARTMEQPSPSEQPGSGFPGIAI